MTATEAPTRYITLACGESPALYRQSVMLLLSLVAYAPEPRELVVATDRPERYAWFGTRVEIEYLDHAVLDGWRGRDPFSMREKLALLRAAWPDAGGIVFLDADVLARADLRPFVRQLHDGAVFMHSREYILSRSRRPANRRMWDALRTAPLRVPVSPEDSMWNSGVVALPESDRALVEEAIGLYEQMAAKGIRHIATEQLVESVVFARTGRLRAAQPWFAHYRGNKEGYDGEIARRLADAFIDGLTVKEAAADYTRRPIDLPLEMRRTRPPKVHRWLPKR